MIKHAYELRLNDEIKSVRGQWGYDYFDTGASGSNYGAQVIGLEFLASGDDRYRVTVRQGVSGDLRRSGHAREFNALDLFELEDKKIINNTM